jgi:uncharacterized membrane protein YdjX (TVP38/TMEM64 family)
VGGGVTETVHSRTDGDVGTSRVARWTRIAAWVLLAVAAVFAVWLLGRKLGGYVPGFTAWVKGLGAWGPVVFIAGYALGTVAFAPGFILTMAAGFLFGLGFGTVYATIAALLGSSGAFLVGRYLARSAIERRLADRPRFAAIDRAVGREGWKLVALLRLSPLLPYNLLNYALGLTRVSFPEYFLGSFAMLPGTLLYVYYGTLVRDLAALAAGAPAERGTEGWVLFGVGLAATVVATYFVSRRARRALAEQVEAAHG